MLGEGSAGFGGGGDGGVRVVGVRWKAGQWLCWVLSARLEENLSEALGVGAGWLGWAMWSLAAPASGRGGTALGWMERLGAAFWDEGRIVSR